MENPATVWPARPVVRALCKMRVAGAASQGDRPQQLGAMSPCEVRAAADSHPLFGQLLVANVFKRLNGLPHLVDVLPAPRGRSMPM
jgi:hypothetical protein